MHILGEIDPIAGALLREGEAGVARGRAVLGRIDLIRVNDRIPSAAGVLLPPGLGSLDAIHIASAQLLGGDRGQLVTYDERMIAVARDLGITTVSPAYPRVYGRTRSA